MKATIEFRFAGDFPAGFVSSLGKAGYQFSVRRDELGSYIIAFEIDEYYIKRDGKA